MARIQNLTRIEDAPPLLAHEQMTLRDYFAAAAVQAFTAKLISLRGREADEVLRESGHETIAEAVATGAYRIADAMLAERAK